MARILKVYSLNLPTIFKIADFIDLQFTGK